MAKKLVVSKYKSFAKAINAKKRVFKWGNIFFAVCESVEEDGELCFSSGDTFIIDGTIYYAGDEVFSSEDELKDSLLKDKQEIGIAVDKMLIYDADGDNAPTLNSNIKKYGYTELSISYNLLGRLLGYESTFDAHHVVKHISLESTQEIKTLLRDKTIKILDGEPDSEFKLTASTTKATILRKQKEGYYLSAKVRRCLEQELIDLAGHTLHRSGSVLVQHENTKYLMGLDDDQYFGVELPASSKATTLEQAFLDLMPKEVQKAKRYERQGEWFVILSELPEVQPQETALYPKGCCENNVSLSFRLPKVDSSSNDHAVVCRNAIMGGRMFVKGPGKIQHHQHAQIHLDEGRWYQIIENTAVRSLSQEGVD